MNNQVSYIVFVVAGTLTACNVNMLLIPTWHFKKPMICTLRTGKWFLDILTEARHGAS